MDHINIRGTIQKDSKIIIVPENWQFMTKGEGHIILQNVCKQDQLYMYVLSICLHEIHSLPEQFEEAYQLILKSISEIQKYLLERKEVYFQKQQQERFREMFQSKVSYKLKTFQVFLLQNLTKSDKDWDYYLQFKPKTPLPEQYQFNFLNQYCKKHEKQLDELITVLNKSPPLQRTRWFKKNALKEKKNNMNPLNIFSEEHHQRPSYSDHLKFSRPEVSIKNTELNDLIHEYLKSTNILNTILKIQLLYTIHNNFEGITEQQLKIQSQKLTENQQSVKKIIEEINFYDNAFEKLKELYKESPIGSKNAKTINNFERILRFLVSWSWRDVSFIIRLKMNKKMSKIQDSDLKIIDYQLKERRKLISTLQKDETFLTYYLTSIHFL